MKFNGGLNSISYEMKLRQKMFTILLLRSNLYWNFQNISAYQLSELVLYFIWLITGGTGTERNHAVQKFRVEKNYEGHLTLLSVQFL